MECEPRWAEVDQGIGGSHDVGGYVRCDGCQGDSQDRQYHCHRSTNPLQEVDRARDDLAEDHLGRGGRGESHECEEAHEDRQPNVAQYLVLLAPGVPCEIGDVEGQGGPEAYVCGEGREEERPELGG